MNWIGCAIVSILLWSSLAYLGTQVAHVPPFLLLGITFLVGSLPSVLRWKSWFQNARILAFGVAGIFGYHFFFFLALRFAPPIEANLVNDLWSVLIVLLSPVFLKGYRLSSRHILGGAIAFLGAAIVVTGGRIHFEMADLPGYLLALAAAFTWASYSLMTKRLPLFPTSAVGGFCFVSGVLAMFAHALLEQSTLLSWMDGVTLLYLGLGPMGVAFYSWDRALKDGDPRVVGGLSYLIPLLSSLALMIFGGRQARPSIFLAIALIVGGAVLGTWQRKPTSRDSLS